MFCRLCGSVNIVLRKFRGYVMYAYCYDCEAVTDPA